MQYQKSKKLSLEQVAWRSGFLTAAAWFAPKLPCVGEPKGFDHGNRKTGTSGSVLKSVLVWNLPPVATCPGCSDWCTKYCYNADKRADIFPIGNWCENWAWVETEPDKLRDVMLGQIQRSPPPVGIRIHSSGDFYSNNYIKFWQSIIEATPKAAFWAYTRSWREPSLLEGLNRLKKLSSLQLFASYDYTISCPPQGWRHCAIANDIDAAEKYIRSHSDSLICRKDIREVLNCASCGFCGKPSSKSIVFFTH